MSVHPHHAQEGAVTTQLAMMDRPTGFSLLELMITIGLVFTLATIAVPSYNSLIQRNRATSEANALLLLLTYARGEAIKRGQRVMVCKSVDGAACSTAGSVGWEQGVLVFADPGGGNTLLRAEFPFSSSSAIVATAPVADGVTYLSSGLSAGDIGSFTIKPSNSAQYQRKVILSVTGRPRVE